MKLLHAAAALALSATAGSAGTLDLSGTRVSPYDLEVSGHVAGLRDGATRYVPWSRLRALPTRTIKVDGEFVKGPQVLTVVFLSDLWKALPVDPGTDSILATCNDGYAGIYTLDFIGSYRPFLVLEINGKGPEDWPPPGLAFNPGPYVITVSAEVAPSAATFLDIEHKKPWAVTKIEIARFSDRFRGSYSGKWASLGPAAQAGRTIWINSCASCHPGPGTTFGGTKSGRPFPVVAAYAAYDRAYFVQYVRNPKSLVPSAKMEAHPHYTDAQMAELIEFISAGQS
jgi:cytochrome c2